MLDVVCWVGWVLCMLGIFEIHKRGLLTTASRLHRSGRAVREGGTKWKREVRPFLQKREGLETAGGREGKKED